MFFTALRYFSSQFFLRCTTTRKSIVLTADIIDQFADMCGFDTLNSEEEKEIDTLLAEGSWSENEENRETEKEEIFLYLIFRYPKLPNNFLPS